MDLSRYISDLLFENDFVAIPGFGELTSKYLPARIDAKNHIFIPPTKALTFNAENSGNDSSLAAYIAKHEQIPEEQARKKIEVFIENFNKKLEENEAVVLPDIGKFLRKKEENKINFLPDRSVNYNLKSYGLTEVQTFPVVRKIVTYENEPENEEENTELKGKKVKKVKKEKKATKEKKEKGGLFKLSKKAKTASLYGIIVIVLGALLTIQLITWENRPENVFQAAASFFKHGEGDELDQIEQMISQEDNMDTEKSTTGNPKDAAETPVKTEPAKISSVPAEKKK